MSLPALDLASLKQEYGDYGRKTIEQMQKVLNLHGFAITYNPATGQFTIPNSSHPDERRKIESLFTINSYQGWQPKILAEIVEGRNLRVKLECFVSDSDITELYHALAGRERSNLK